MRSTDPDIEELRQQLRDQELLTERATVTAAAAVTIALFSVGVAFYALRKKPPTVINVDISRHPGVWLSDPVVERF